MTSPQLEVPRAISAAVLARLQSAVDPVYDGKVPLDDNGRPQEERYGVVWFDTPQRSRDSLAGVADRWTRTWRLTSVGVDHDQVEWVATRCQDALLDERLVVPGWHLGLVEHTSSGPIRIDRDIPGAQVFYGVDSFAVTATR